MALREDLLAPITGDNPSGVDVRYDTKLLLYDKIKEARRQDDELAQGAWQHERKTADYSQVIRLAQDALASKTKDLQLAAWLTEALLHTERFGGLRQGLSLCHGLVSNFWDTLYPPIEDGDMELRAAPLDWIGVALEIPVKSTSLTRDGYSLLQYKDSKTVGYESEATNDKDRKARAKKVADGKLAPEMFDKSFAETPKAFYLQSENDLDACLEALRKLEELCNEKLGDAAPSFGKLKIALEEVRHTVHGLLQKKRETEPDPVEEAPAPVASGDAPAAAAAAAGALSIGIPIVTSSEPADRQEAIRSLAEAASFLRKREPYSPASYLMMRGLRWGELRLAARRGDATLLEGPPTELRQHVRRLALGRRWAEVLETAENAMALPCSRGWLDLQRYVVEACAALGSDYDLIASAICSELRALISDIPQLLEASLLDDTPVANAETKAWLQQLLEGPAEPVTPAPGGDNPIATESKPRPGSPWRARGTDPFTIAQEALKAGQPEKAFDIMRREIANQRSGRGKFQRTLQLVQLCVSAGKEVIAQPLLEDLMAAIESHKLDDWEDKEMVAAALAMVMTTSKKIQGNAGERQKLFDRICRLDPVRALGTSG